MGARVHASAGPDGAVAPLDWFWVSASVLCGALLLALFLAVVDPGIVRLRVSGGVFAATLVLTGILIGYRSPGLTTWEPGVGGLVLVLLSATTLTLYTGKFPSLGALAITVPLAPLLAIAGAWTGEVLQGTYRDAAVGLQWLWVLVAIVVGFAAGLYSVFLAEALLGVDYLGILAFFGASFLLTGFVVGFFSPGRTILEPAIAIGGLILLDVVFSLLYFRAWFPVGAVLLALLAGIVLSVTGAWMGEATQDIRMRRQVRKAGRTPGAWRVNMR